MARSRRRACQREHSDPPAGEQGANGARDGYRRRDPPAAIICRGRLVAVAARDRFFLCDELERRPRGDPEACFVAFMCAYALDVVRGELPGPYNDDDARRYARAWLIPDELLERRALDVPRAARALGLPADELAAAHAGSRARAQREGSPSSPRRDATSSRWRRARAQNGRGRGPSDPRADGGERLGGRRFDRLFLGVQTTAHRQGRDIHLRLATGAFEERLRS